MALYQIERYHNIPEVDRDRIVKNWMDQFAAIIDCGMIKMKTINMLQLRKRIGVGEDGTEQWGRLTLDEMKKVHTLMATDVSGKDGFPEDPVLARRIFIAQPVALTKEFIIIRAAIGAPL